MGPGGKMRDVDMRPRPGPLVNRARHPRSSQDRNPGTFRHAVTQPGPRHDVQDVRRLSGAAALAHRQLTRMGPRLLRDARRDCAREGVKGAYLEIIGRVARRVGVPLATAAAILARTDAASAAAAERLYRDDTRVAHLDQVRARRRLIVLAETVLGFRERIVFLGRCLGTAAPLTRLAQRFGTTPAHVAAIEISARRKIVTAAWVEGLTDIAGLLPARHD